jgi:hypothetical protein
MLPAFQSKKASRDFWESRLARLKGCASVQLVSTSFSRIANPLFLKKKERYVKAK